MNKNLPKDANVFIRIKQLYKNNRLTLSERMSSRMVKCASVLERDEYIGWQMEVPVKGKISMNIFGSSALSVKDLEWIGEKMGKTTPKISSTTNLEFCSEVYEYYIPASEISKNTSGIGFGASDCTPSNRLSKWPDHYSSTFDEIVKALQQTGGTFRAVLSSADEKEQEYCRKNFLHTSDIPNINNNDYLGIPVKAAFLIKLPSNLSVRLRSVLEEAVHGSMIRYIGSMNDPYVTEYWNSPLKYATVLPDYAVRILMLEPLLNDTMIGIETCETEMKKIPFTHRNTRDKGVVTIGKGTSTSGIRQNIYLNEIDLKRHYQVIGQTGTGKSTLLANLILSAIEQDHGVTFFDPHGTTIDMIIRAVPKKYAEKIRVVRIGDTENPVPLNIWDSDDPLKEEKNITDLCELFSDIFDPKNYGIIGPRYERWLSTFAKASIAFLGRRASFESIAQISQGKNNMFKVATAIKDKYPDLYNTIMEEFGKDDSKDFNATLSYYLSKFQRLTAVEEMRKTLGAGTNALDFNHTIDTNTVTLIDLASTKIGTSAARIIGTMTLMKLWNATMQRKNRDQTHLVVVDEAALFQTNPMPRMLAESRKFGFSMILCHQHASQLTQEIRDALESNSANISAFRLSPQDAQNEALRFNDPHMMVDLARMDAYYALTSISVKGKQSDPFILEINKCRPRKDGEVIAREIEKRSIRTLVEPYKNLRAYSKSEIQHIIDHAKPVKHRSTGSRLRDYL